MFGQTGYASAQARYRSLDLTTKVEGATPHRLIAILFEELLKSLDTMAAGLAAGATPFSAGMPERRARATAILLGLEGSLDHERGGELARGLSAIYREARRRLVKGDADAVRETREMIAEIATAWNSIG